MPASIVHTLLLLAALSAASCAAEPVGAASPGAFPAQAAAPAQLLLAPDRGALQGLGLRLDGDGGGALLRLTLQPEPGFAVELADGAPTRVLDGAFAVPGLALRRRDGVRSPALRLVPAPGSPLDLDLVDEADAVWLRVRLAMRSADPADGLRLITADLRAGPALAAFAGRDAEGLLLGNVELRATLSLPPATGAFAKSCAAPDWPTDPGTVTDVHLLNIDTVDVLRCRAPGEPGCSTAYGCDGPGGLDGEVVVVPSATLRNSDAANAADVPWYRKFSGYFPPYALPEGNDQHPYLVWSMYRIDADGALVQLGRSGLKHAFATANTGCTDTSCTFVSDILGRGCSDLYNAASNDTWSALGPRAEVIPVTGQWGRCGSVFDDIVNATGEPGCDGVEDAPPPSENDCYRHRLVVHETEIDPALNPGARWYVDAWYVVRDDVDIFNTMGWREVVPVWGAGLSPQRWTLQLPSAFTAGTVLDAWLAAAPLSEWTGRTLIDSAEGRTLVAVRARDEGSQYRYDYAVMNFDLTRPVTQGSEPDLVVERNLGLDAFAVTGAGGASMSEAGFEDGDTDPGNDWIAATDAQGTTWTAPQASAELAWGQLMGFSLTSAHPPGDGGLALRFAEAGSPATLTAAGLAPDAAKIFSSRFE